MHKVPERTVWKELNQKEAQRADRSKNEKTHLRIRIGSGRRSNDRRIASQPGKHYLQCAWFQASMDCIERVRSVQDKDLAEFRYSGETGWEGEKWTARDSENGLGWKKRKENCFNQATAGSLIFHVYNLKSVYLFDEWWQKSQNR